MANTASAKKRARQNIQRRTVRIAQLTRLRTYVKKVIAAVRSGDAQQARTAFNQAQPIIDSAVNKGLIKKNKAARSKSRLHARVKALSLASA